MAFSFDRRALEVDNMTVKTPIVIVGAGGYARAIHDAITGEDVYDVLGFVDNHAIAGQLFCGLPVQLESDFVASGYNGGIVVGLGDNALREKVVLGLRKRLPNTSFPVITHPRAIVSRSARIGHGSVILGGAVVGANVEIGEFGSIWSNAVIEHDSIASDFVTLAPSATTGGSVTIGARTFLGLGCQILHNIRVGSDCVISAGAVVSSNVADLSVMIGVPALCNRRRIKGESYL